MRTKLIIVYSLMTAECFNLIPWIKSPHTPSFEPLGNILITYYQHSLVHLITFLTLLLLLLYKTDGKYK